MTANQKIRNFCIISHIDHGKSTLADRFLELTGAVEKRKMREQFLDMMELEREKGITIKLQPVRMEYQGYILNLIDTPGHVDFTYEVSRSLAAVEGAILLVDAGKGVQAQTLANLHLAQKQNLVVIPAINKIDLPHARIEETIEEMSQLLKTDRNDILKISAKKGENIEKLLNKVVEKVPPPRGGLEKTFRALIFDSSYDNFKGVIIYLKVIDGQIKRGERIKMLASSKEIEVVELGIFTPAPVRVDSLSAGEIGYLSTGLKEIGQCRVGDTVALVGSKAQPWPGYQEPKPMVFASFYPINSEDYNLLKDGLEKLRLNDASLQYEPESSEGLGRGFRCGFLGMLHLEIVSERLKRERKLNLVVTSPLVGYRLTTKKGQSLLISSASDLEKTEEIERIEEPWVNLEIIAPSQYLGPIMNLLENLRGEYKETEYLSADRVLVRYEAPLADIVIDFYDRLKNISSGYASMNYQMIEYRPGDLAKIDVLIAGKKTEALSKIVPRGRALTEGRALVKKLKEVIPPQLFAVPLQAALGGKIIARETIPALKKDVIGHLYGGDYSRKKKLLEKQKKGKKKMKVIGRVNVPQEVFLKVLKK